MSKRELSKLIKTADVEGSRRKHRRETATLPESSSEVDVKAGEGNLFENGDSRHGEGGWGHTCCGPSRRPKPEFRRFCRFVTVLCNPDASIPDMFLFNLAPFLPLTAFHFPVVASSPWFFRRSRLVSCILLPDHKESYRTRRYQGASRYWCLFFLADYSHRL